MEEEKAIKKPKRWKMMFIAFVFVYVVINVTFFFIGDLVADMHQLLRTFILAGIFVPIFGFGIPYCQNKCWCWVVG